MYPYFFTTSAPFSPTESREDDLERRLISFVFLFLKDVAQFVDLDGDEVLAAVVLNDAAASLDCLSYPLPRPSAGI